MAAVAGKTGRAELFFFIELVFFVEQDGFGIDAFVVTGPPACNLGAFCQFLVVEKREDMWFVRGEEKSTIVCNVPCDLHALAFVLLMRGECDSVNAFFDIQCELPCLTFRVTFL